tara:strand:+ start:558 stop:818 length:261 start_codon:yes stop_codon:yes gene_type:complete
MLKKTLGYIILILGIVGFVLTFESITTALNLTLPEQLTITSLSWISLALIIIGALLAFKRSGKKKKTELPIYDEKEIVGFRRVKKK